MQMPISNASPSKAPAASSSASAKGTEGGKFNQAFVQTVAGATGKEANAQAGTEAAAPAGTAAKSTPASLLGDHASPADLLSMIEALIQQLGDTDSDDLAAKATEADLADALQQLDNLLSALAGVPMLQLPNASAPVAAAGDGSSASQGETGDAGGALLAILAGMNAAAPQGASIQAAETAVPDQSQAVVANLEQVNALKSGLQEALADLKALLEDQKNISANREQLALVGKQLGAIEQLVSGSKPQLAAANAGGGPTVDGAAANDAASADSVNSVRALLTTHQSSAHLQRMAHRLLHVGLLNAVQKPEANEGEDAPATMDADSQDIQGQLGIVGPDIQRQLAAIVKPAVTQPVPVQQFASTIQGMVVKQFNLTTGNGISQAQLTLYPEHLGQVNVNISVHNGTLTAQFVTDTVTAKDMLENQMAQLRSALQSQGLQVEKLVVSQQEVQANLFQDRQGAQGQQQGSARRNKPQDDAIGEVDFTADLEQVSTQQAVERDLGLGRGIHTIV